MKLAGKNCAPPSSLYPYAPPVGPAAKNACRNLPQSSYTPVNIDYIADIGPATEDDLMYQVATFGPQVVAIYASTNLQFYQSGIFNDDNCFTGNCYIVNHAVVVVGYGTDPVQGDYWLIRNSWGAAWVRLNLREAKIENILIHFREKMDILNWLEIEEICVKLDAGSFFFFLKKQSLKIYQIFFFKATICIFGCCLIH